MQDGTDSTLEVFSGRKFAWSVPFFFLVWLFVGAGYGQTVERPIHTGEEVICGPNAVNAMLLASGIPADRSPIEFHADSRNAMSLAEVADAITKRGLVVAIRRISVSDLRAPSVLLFCEQRGIGHYVLFLGKRQQNYLFLDPTTSRRFELTALELTSIWNGYSIIRPPQKLSSAGSIAVLICAGVILGAWIKQLCSTVRQKKHSSSFA